MKKFSLLFLSLFIIGSISLKVFAQVTSVSSGEWNTAGTWSTNTVPIATDNVTINNNHAITLTTTGGLCTALTMNPGSSLTLNGALALPGTATRTLDPTSTVIYAGSQSSIPNVTFGNLTWSGSANTNTGTNSITIAGDLTINSGTVRGNAGTSGTNTQTVMGNVYINGTGRISGVNNSGATSGICTWNITGDVHLADGGTGRLILFESAGPHSGSSTFNIGGNFYIGTGMTVQLRSSTTANTNSATGTIKILKDVTNAANSITSVGGGTGCALVINMAGSSAQTWSGDFPNIASPLTDTVNINNSAGVTLTSSASFTGNGTLTLTNGKLTLGANNLTLTNSITVLGGSATSYIATNGSGGLIQSVGTSAVFPVGDVSYRPVTLSSITGTSPVISVKVTYANSGGTHDGTLSSISPSRYWSIGLVSGVFTGSTVNLTYGTDDGVTLDNTKLLIGTSASTSGTYTSAGPTGGAGGSFIGSGSITSDAIVSLGTPTYFLLANNPSGTNPLPVELSTFTANNNGRTIQLNWETKTEVKLNKFEIDRALASANDASVTWASVGSVPASGTSNSPKKYSYTEKDLQTGKYQYRLKMIDNDGSYKFSNIVETDITSPKNFELSQNYPNPFNPSTRINYSIPFDSRVTLEVFNIIGERMGQIVNEEQSAGYYTVNFSSSNLNKSITSGVYIYKINAVDKSTGNIFTSIKKMMLLK